MAVAGAAEVGEKVEGEVAEEEEEEVEEVEVEEEKAYADSAAVAAGVAAAAVTFPCLHHRLAHLWSDGPPLAFGTLAAPRAPGGRNQARTPVLQRPLLPP